MKGNTYSYSFIVKINQFQISSYIMSLLCFFGRSGHPND